jgi:hypothetical protein
MPMIRAFVVCVVLVASSLGALAPASAATKDETTVVAQAEGTRDGELEPRYQPREPEPPEAYNDDYLFAMTRGVADAPIAPAGKVALYVLTVPVDIVLLPFALIGGLFG